MFLRRWLLYPQRPAPRVAANQGRMVHWLREHGPDSLSAFNNDLQTQIAPLVDLIDSGQDPLGEVASQIKFLNDSANRATAIATLIWEKEAALSGDLPRTLCREEHITTGLLLHDEKGNEQPFEIEGTIDHLVEDVDSGRKWIKDTKTTGRDSAMTLTGYQYSLQCRFYRLLAESWLYHQNQDETHVDDSVYGFIVDVLQMPTIIMSGADRDYTESPHTFTRGAHKGETEMRREYTGDPKMENYIKRCVEWYKVEDVKPVESFSIAYTESALGPELYQALRITGIYTNCEPNPELFPKDVTASHCKAYNRVCDYYALCSSDYAKWPSLIETGFCFHTPEQVRTHQVVTLDTSSTPEGQA